MAHWPKSVTGNLFMLLLAVAVVPVVVSVAVALSGPLVWASLAAVGLAIVVLYTWRRRLETARERAWVGEFSFGDVVRRMHAREARDVSLALEGVH